MTEPKHDPMIRNVESHCPAFKKHTFTVGGYLVPHITGIPIDGGKAWNITLDSRFGIVMYPDELEKFLSFIAHAMAVAAGFSCHGAGSVPMNIYNRAVFGIGSITTEPGDPELDE